MFIGGIYCNRALIEVAPETWCYHEFLVAGEVGESLLWVVFDVKALQLHELVETKLAQRLALSRIFPARPREVL